MRNPDASGYDKRQNTPFANAKRKLTIAQKRLLVIDYEYEVKRKQQVARIAELESEVERLERLIAEGDPATMRDERLPERERPGARSRERDRRG